MEEEDRFWRDRVKMGYILSSRELSIARGDDLPYLRWGSPAESRFSLVSLIINMLWLSILE